MDAHLDVNMLAVSIGTKIIGITGSQTGFFSQEPVIVVTMEVMWICTSSVPIIAVVMCVTIIPLPARTGLELQHATFIETMGDAMMKMEIMIIFERNVR